MVPPTAQLCHRLPRPLPQPDRERSSAASVLREPRPAWESAAVECGVTDGNRAGKGRSRVLS